MPTSIRQQIVAAVFARMQTITISNGYQTSLGTKTELWRVSDYTEDELAGNIPHGSLTDPSEESKNFTMGGGPNSRQEHELLFEYRLVMSDTADTSALSKKAIADVTKAIGVDPKWGGLAIDTLPGKTTLDMEQKKKKIAAFDYSFKVKYHTRRFDPYSQA